VLDSTEVTNAEFLSFTQVSSILASFFLLTLLYIPRKQATKQAQSFMDGLLCSISSLEMSKRGKLSEAQNGTAESKAHFGSDQ
jgi:hypothetical protein